MPPAPPAVLIVGSVNVDFVLRVEHLPAPGETVTGGTLARHQGGKGANQAVAAARLGAAVSFVGAVGDDELGREALAELRSEGIDVHGVATMSGTPTGVALIVVDARGENQIAVASGANALLDRPLVERYFAAARLGEGGVYLANFEVPDEALLAGARRAAQSGMSIVINPAPARPLAEELLGLRPIVIANSGEAATLTGEPDPGRAARRLSGMSGAPAIMTLGARGALLAEADNLFDVAAFGVETVDTTGAGDTFAGAFAAQLATGSSVGAAARFASAAAALSVTREGARGGMPTRDQVEALVSG